jgi:hypothetical protein
MISNLSSFLKKLGVEEQSKLKASRRKKIITTKVEIIKLEK